MLRELAESIDASFDELVATRLNGVVMCAELLLDSAIIIIS